MNNYYCDGSIMFDNTIDINKYIEFISYANKQLKIMYYCNNAKYFYTDQDIFNLCPNFDISSKQYVVAKYNKNFTDAYIYHWYKIKCIKNWESNIITLLN